MTNPNSQVISTTKGLEQAFYLQYMVGCESHIVLDVDTVQDCNDKHQMVPMLDRLTKRYGRPIALTDDAGYCSLPALPAALALDVMIFMPAKNRHNVRDITREGPPPKDLGQAEQVEWTMAALTGRGIYRMHRGTLEPCLGIINSTMGFRQSS